MPGLKTMEMLCRNADLTAVGSHISEREAQVRANRVTSAFVSVTSAFATSVFHLACSLAFLVSSWQARILDSNSWCAAHGQNALSATHLLTDT
jgi:hypothetical protein